MLKLIVYCLLLIYMIGAIVSVFTFIIDTFRWHKREEHVKIVPSALGVDKEVIKVERRDDGRAPGRGDNDNDSGRGDNNGDNNDNSSDNFF